MGIDLNDLTIDDSGRVILSDEDMLEIEQIVTLAGAAGNNNGCPGTTNSGGCTNDVNCQGSTNGGCTNQLCGGSTNYGGCLNTETHPDM